jgi:hypothetical protein
MKLGIFISFIALFAISCEAQDKTQDNLIRNYDSLMLLPQNLPVKFDLRNTGRIGTVKSQPNGGCWASAAIGSVESVWRTFHLSDEILSDLNLKLFHGFIPERNSNGNHYMATAFFTRRSGPQIKSPETDSVLNKSAFIPFSITGARYLPDNPEWIKKTIINFGAVYSMMYHRRADLDTLTNIYYSKKLKINHAVILVGWDDTMITKFGKGVWIAQNSLGIKYGDKGFFYIPYADPNILEYNAIWPECIPFDSNSQLYYYDTLGSYQSYGFGDTICFGLVKFVAENDIEVIKVATHVNVAGVKVTTRIYDTFNPTTGVLDGLLFASTPETCLFAGYYTFDLAEKVSIEQGNDFYVQLGYSHPTDTLLLPVEKFIKGYSDPHITSKKCWINPDFNRWPATWYECGTESFYPELNFNLCIRVYSMKVR